MSKRRSYTKEQREAALADVAKEGVVEAARKLGAPQSCGGTVDQLDELAELAPPAA